MRRRPARKTGAWTDASTRIALIGDSTLDNVLWVGDDPSISEQLVEAIPGAAVANLAADGYTSADALHGSRTVISVGVRGRVGEPDGCDPLQFDDDGIFRPLRRMAQLAPPPTHIVVSVGGNDVREILRDMSRLSEVVQDFPPRYLAIVDACLRVTPNVVLMMQYRPSFYMDGGGYGVYQAFGCIPGPGDAVEKINRLMQEIYVPVLAMARDRKLPVVDLPRTFDIYSDELYSHQIEPSAKGGEVIAAILRHVVANDSPEKPSTLYTYVPCIPGEGHVEEEITGQRPWVIPHDGTRTTSPGPDGAADAQVMALVGMGFERETVVAALARSGGDQGRAVAVLLGEEP